jgi:putative hemolysin
MSQWEIIFWFVVMALGLAGSAVYSGLETGAYSLNRVRLEVLSHQKDKAACLLERLVTKPTSLLSTLLIGNNLTNYMGTAGLTVLLERHWQMEDWQIIVTNMLIVAPLLFIFGETLPKDLFSAYSDKLMYRLVGFLSASRFLFTVTGLVPLIGIFHSVMSRLFGFEPQSVLHPRRQVELLVKEGVGRGLLSDEQSAIIERVLSLAGRTVADEMIPWSKVQKVHPDDSPKLLWDYARQSDRSRFPVVDETGQAVGMVSLYKALRYEESSCPAISELVEPVTTIDAMTPLRDGLSNLQAQGAALAVVVRNSIPVGVVTAKDLVEPVTGELTNL